MGREGGVQRPHAFTGLVWAYASLQVGLESVSQAF